MSNPKTSGGSGFTGLLVIAFIVLKLCGVIHWSWWWVLSPIWISASIVFTLVGFYALVAWWIKKTESPNERAARLCGEIARRLERQHK